MRRLRDPASAEDLTQEVLIKLLQQPEQRGDSYVFQIAQNLLIDQRRRATVRDRHLRSALADEQRDRNPIDAHTILEGQQQLGLAAEVLAALPDRTRQIFILYRFEKMSQHDIGLAFGISSSAVKQHVAKAMAALARALRNDR
ncbi:RNA polymerase sigma factor [Sphingomonas sp. CLY1604]|uniref:RNA polymerase sigma factor n=1 Tax=Sphingomonas sp. CLY1604 TaxID=3457786 RepID=UPI003FD7A96D